MDTYGDSVLVSTGCLMDKWITRTIPPILHPIFLSHSTRSMLPELPPVITNSWDALQSLDYSQFHSYQSTRPPTCSAIFLFVCPILDRKVLLNTRTSASYRRSESRWRWRGKGIDTSDGKIKDQLTHSYIGFSSLFSSHNLNSAQRGELEWAVRSRFLIMSKSIYHRTIGSPT